MFIASEVCTPMNPLGSWSESCFNCKETFVHKHFWICTDFETEYVSLLTTMSIYQSYNNLCIGILLHSL